jgi:hypothetical protein
MRKSAASGIAIALAVLLVGCSSGGSPSPSGAAPSGEPTSDTLASGNFTADLGSWAQAFEIEATGTGDNVSGTMEVTHPDSGNFTVDLQCSRTTDDGLIAIGGEVTESTNEIASEGVYAAILLAPGTPVRTLLWIDDDPPADSCTAFLDKQSSDPEFLGLTSEDLVPIEGDLELAP